MLGLKRSFVKSDFTLLRRFRSFHLCIAIFGWVLLASVLACDSASAWNNKQFPSENNEFMIYNQTIGGCLQQSQTLSNGASIMLGDISYTGFSCGNILYNSDESIAHGFDSGSNDELYCDGLNCSISHDEPGGYNTFTANDGIDDMSWAPDVTNGLYSIEIYTNSSFISKLPSNISEGYVTVFYKFDLGSFDTESTPYWGPTYYIPAINSISYVDDNGDYVSNSSLQQSLTESIAESVYWSCGDGDNFSESFDLAAFNFGSGFNEYTCGFVFDIPMSHDYRIDVKHIDIDSPSPYNQYGWESAGSEALNNPNYYTPLFRTEAINHLDTLYPPMSFKNSTSPQLNIIIPQNEAEYNASVGFHENHLNANNDQLSPPTPANNVFMSWFNVFGFNFLFPFRSVFTSFTNDTCVNIPIIAGMVHSSNTQYCTWWSSSVRNTLTPAFNMLGMMILTGFIFHWLGKRSDNLVHDNNTTRLGDRF